MMNHSLAFGIGAAVVGTAAIVIAYKIYSDRKERFASESKIATRELMKNCAFVDELSIKELTAWFKENRDKFIKEAKMIVAIPTAERMRQLGYSGEVDVDESKNIIQFFYDFDKNRILDIRAVSFSEIESNLQAQLLEQNGLIVLTN